MDEDTKQPNPQENPDDPAHLPVSGEVNAGPVPNEDPLTLDTDDSPESAMDRIYPPDPDEPLP